MNYKQNDFNSHYQMSRFTPKQEQNRQQVQPQVASKVSSPAKVAEKGGDDLGSWRNNN